VPRFPASVSSVPEPVNGDVSKVRKTQPIKRAGHAKKQKANSTRCAARRPRAKPRQPSKRMRPSRTNDNPIQCPRCQANLRMASLVSSRDIIELAQTVARAVAKTELDARSNQADGRGSRVERITVATLAFTVVGIMVAMLSLEIQTNQSTRKLAEDLLMLQKQIIESKRAYQSGSMVQSPKEEPQPQQSSRRKRKSRRREVMPVIKSVPNPAAPTENKPLTAPVPSKGASQAKLRESWKPSLCRFVTTVSEPHAPVSS